jgi:hypothetical protein
MRNDVTFKTLFRVNNFKYLLEFLVMDLEDQLDFLFDAIFGA